MYWNPDGIQMMGAKGVNKISMNLHISQQYLPQFCPFLLDKILMLTKPNNIHKVFLQGEN